MFCTVTYRMHYTLVYSISNNITDKSNPVTGLEWPRKFYEVKLPRFLDNGRGWW
jgi:hypothetical protein